MYKQPRAPIGQKGLGREGGVLQSEGEGSSPCWGLRLAKVRIKDSFPYKMGKLRPRVEKGLFRVTEQGAAEAGEDMGALMPSVPLSLFPSLPRSL